MIALFLCQPDALSLISPLDPKRFSIFAPGEFGDLLAYDSGGVWVEVKKPKYMDFVRSILLLL